MLASDPDTWSKLHDVRDERYRLARAIRRSTAASRLPEDFIYDVQDGLLNGGASKPQCRRRGHEAATARRSGDLRDDGQTSRGNEALLHAYIDSKGNFGKSYSRDMAYAASRYTRSAWRPSERAFFRHRKTRVDMVDNYDATRKEPRLLPCRFDYPGHSNVGIAWAWRAPLTV